MWVVAPGGDVEYYLNRKDSIGGFREGGYEYLCKYLKIISCMII